MKLLRYGPVGQEKPGLMDENGTIRDLSGKVSDIANTAIHWAAPMCLRLAALFLRRREVEALPELKVKLLEQGIQMSVPKNWLITHPLTQYSLETEVEQWQRIGLQLELLTRR